MINSAESMAFERGISSLLKVVLPGKAAEIVAWQGDQELSARIDQLVAKSAEGELLPAERAEYAGYVRANKFVAILQLRARQVLEAVYN